MAVGLLSLVACSLSGCRNASGVNPWTQGAHRTYATRFTSDENPISEGGNWRNGKTDGLDWSDVRTSNGLAFGTQVPPTGPPYNDSVALLTGPWNPDQMVTGVVHTRNPQGGHTYEEVELWLRGSIAPHFTTGYEINFRCLTRPEGYVQFGYWEGPLNKFHGLGETKGPGLKDGDVVSASIVGNTITIWINGVQVLQGKDPGNRYRTGSPGLGFYYQGKKGAVTDYGFTSYSASDEAAVPLPPEALVLAVK
jgi:hypothetical protein